jgi:[ribosomal protein S5]-alanine N-acetyltransferase
MAGIHLRTQRLNLRPLVLGDAAAIHAITSDPAAMRFWDWPAFRDFETTADLVAGQVAEMEAGTALYWAVCLEPSGPAIGCCDLSAIERHHGRAELGFLLQRSHWGRGYAAEAMAAIVDHAFGPEKLDRLWARFHAGNDRSRSLLEKLGFAYEGTLRGHVQRDGVRRDCVIYGRLRS